MIALTSVDSLAMAFYIVYQKLICKIRGIHTEKAFSGTQFRCENAQAAKILSLSCYMVDFSLSGML